MDPSQKKNPIALILAGGFATRLWPLTEKRAKPLLPLAGKALIVHLIERIPEDIPLIISTNQAFATDFEHLKDLFPDRSIRIFIEDSVSDASKKGALAATSLAIQSFGIDQPLLLLAGDNYMGFSMEQFVSTYRGKTLLASFDTKSLRAAKQFGVVEVEENRLVSFVEKPEDPSSTLVSTGCYLFAPEDLFHVMDYARLSADNLGGIFEYLLARRQEVDVFQFSEDWIDIGSFESYLQAHSQLMSDHQIGENCVIENSELGEAVQLGDDVTVENSRLERVIILDRCQIRGAQLRDCIIDEDSVIENVDLTKKMIRAGSIIQGKAEPEEVF